jgi:peptidoglycan/xylan/chitin deacetylase (PgdA/CDA1 family)
MFHRHLLLLAWSTCFLAPAQDVARIATWQGDRAGAMAFVLDDGQREQAIIGAPLFDDVGLLATFVINPGKVAAVTGEGWYASWDEWRAVAKGGHEIGNHSMTHPNFTTAPESVLEEEIAAAQHRIEKEIGRPCHTFCYPFNAETPAARALVAKTHAVSTNTRRKAYGGPKFIAAQANAWADEAIAQRSLVVAMIHGIDTGYLPFAGRAVLRDHLAYVKSKSDQLWVAPLGVVDRYRQERETAKLDVQSGERTVILTLECDLDPLVYDVPLTVVIAAGGEPTMVQAMSATSPDGITTTVHGSAIHCEVLPGKGPVTVRWK